MRNQFTVKEILFAQEALGEDASEEEIEGFLLHERDTQDWERERDIDVHETPYIEAGRHNCDDWGTGEGRYHGRM